MFRSSRLVATLLLAFAAVVTAQATAILMMVERRTYLAHTAYPGRAIDLDVLPAPIRAKAEYVIPHARRSLRTAIARGVRIAFGTDAGVFPHGQNAREFKVLVDAGLSPIDAVRAATLNAAALLGVQGRGRIAPGLLADIIAVRGNPLDDVPVLEDAAFVMKGGDVYRRP